jgi:hypothetical protein
MSALLSLLLLLAPVKLEHAQFNIVRDGNKIGSEEFTVAKQGANYLIDGKTTIGDMTISSRMELDDKLLPVSYQASSREGTLRVKIASPISEIESVVAGETSSADFRFPDGGLILDNNFFHHYLVLLYRAQAGQSAFTVFVPQDRSLGTATVRSTGPRAYDLQVGEVKMQATTDSDGRLLKLSFPSARVVVER